MPHQKNIRESSSPQTFYAMVHRGLESVASDEIVRDLGGEVMKSTRGFVIFRVPTIDNAILRLLTTEDVFLLAWGTDTLTYRAIDLRTIRDWTAKRVAWNDLFRIHHQLRPKFKGKPTYRIVCQMQGEHGYRRRDALTAFLEGLNKHIPAGWSEAEENAWLELWLTIHGRTAVCGVRLSDRSMRHRRYKHEHVAASLRPSMAAAIVRLADIGPDMTVLDPMCGAGTLLAETIELSKKRKYATVQVIGGDIDPHALYSASENLARVGPAELVRWDIARLPLAEECIDRLICNPPFGKQLSRPENLPELYGTLAREGNRVLRPGAMAAFITSEHEILRQALQDQHMMMARQLPVRILGQSAVISVWKKPLSRF